MPFAKYLRQHSCPIRRKKPRETSSDFSTLHTVHELQTPKQLDPHWLKFCSARRNTKGGFRSLHCGWSCIFKASLLDGIYQFHKDPVTPKLFIKHNRPPTCITAPLKSGSPTAAAGVGPVCGILCFKTGPRGFL